LGWYFTKVRHELSMEEANPGKSREFNILRGSWNGKVIRSSKPKRNA